MRHAASLALFVALCCSACGGGGGGSNDGASLYDVNMDFEFTDLPPGCPPGKANELGVGKPCTRGGNECHAQGLQCTCDSVAGLTPPGSTPCFCTRVYVNGCSASSVCGTSATCCALQQVAGSGIGGCLPNECLDNGACPVIMQP